MTLAEFLIHRLAYRDSRVASGDPIGWVHQIRLESAAARQIVFRVVAAEGSDGGALAWVLRYLAIPYADHPDYREEWGHR